MSATNAGGMPTTNPSGVSTTNPSGMSATNPDRMSDFTACVSADSNAPLSNYGANNSALLPTNSIIWMPNSASPLSDQDCTSTLSATDVATTVSHAMVSHNSSTMSNIANRVSH